MQNPTDNVCIRCGKPRIVTKTWKESTKGGVITHTTTTCPDPDCQKIIDRQFAAQKEKREAIEKGKQQRIQASKIKKNSQN
ncbi:hypothetical protein HZB97_03035 [Candidatus Gottesmanbacteria bacterium]|nr:hypothetical protein [Candidatus Gottesmanbacteria bacterium]